MIRNYFISAIRFFLRNRGYAIINTIGLALGIACTVLIFLYVFDEMRYDRHHEKMDRIYMVCRHGIFEGEEYNSGWTTPPMAEAMKQDFPEIENFTRLCLWYDEQVYRYEDRYFTEKYVIGADSTVFDIFTIPFIYGDPATALTRPRTIVLTESTARKYFGDINPVGKVIRDEGWERDLEVTGVVKDQPKQSHFYFDILYSMITHGDYATSASWFNHTFMSYLLLSEESNADTLESKFDEFIVNHIGPYLEESMGITLKEFIEMGNLYEFWLLPLKDVHLSQMITEQHHKRSFIYILSIIGLLILVIACINYMNLSTAMAINRSREVGVRKISGGTRTQIIWQYLGESFVMCFIALCLGMLLVELAISFFNELTGKEISINYFSHPLIVPGLICFALLVSFLAGFYPSLVMSSFRPVVALKGLAGNWNGRGNHWLRSVLVVFQFTVCIIILIGTGIVYCQLNYMQTKDLGFDKEQILVIHRADGLGQNHKTFKQELLKHPEIKSVSFSLNTPARHHSDQGHHFKGHPDYQNVSFFVTWADFDYIKTLDLELVEGRDFDINRPTDYYKVIINEAGARALETNDPLNGVFDYSPWPAVDSIQYEIIGVVKDFHFQSLNHDIDSWILYPLRDDISFYANYINIKMQTEKLSSAISMIEDIWAEKSQGYPFEYSFLDEDFNQLFQKEQREKKMYTVFAIFAVIISCLGLLGLASFTANQKTKEIGIRKSMGSTAWQVQALLLKQFFVRILISIVIASTGGYYIMSSWLENFAYRIQMPYWVFALSGIMAICIALLTVSYHSYTAAVRNPATALRYE